MPTHYEGLNNICDTMTLSSTFFAAIIGSRLVDPALESSRADVAYHTFIAFVLFLMAFVVAAAVKSVICLLPGVDELVTPSSPIIQPKGNAEEDVYRADTFWPGTALLVAGALNMTALGILTSGVICRQNGSAAIGETTCLAGSISLLLFTLLIVGIALVYLVCYGRARAAFLAQLDSARNSSQNTSLPSNHSILLPPVATNDSTSTSPPHSSAPPTGSQLHSSFHAPSQPTVHPAVSPHDTAIPSIPSHLPLNTPQANSTGQSIDEKQQTPIDTTVRMGSFPFSSPTVSMAIGQRSV
jgi:hypothetical protein